jgi:hypothetical protein
VLEHIGNALGRFLKSDDDRLAMGLLTYARICVEIDINDSLPDKIILEMKILARL